MEYTRYQQLMSDFGLVFIFFRKRTKPGSILG